MCLQDAQRITRSQQVTLKEMKGWDDEVIMLADKGNA